MKKTITLIALAVMTFLSSLPIAEAQKKPSSNISVRVTIENSSGYMIFSDGRGDYVDGELGVSATIASSGEGDFLMDPSNSQSTNPRALWFDFSQKIASGDIPNPWEGQTVQIDTYLNFNGINTVPVGEVQLRTGGFGQLYSSTSNKSYFNLKFLPTNSTGPNPNLPLINSPNET